MSSYRRLFIWVEGTDDKRFFDTSVVPRLNDRYDRIDVQLYAGMTNEDINKP